MTAAEGLSPSLVTFIRDHIGSLELVEVLLFLHRYPEAAFGPDAIAAELRLQPRSVAGRCQSLVKSGLVAEDSGRCRFAGTGDQAALVGELAQAWASHRARVIETIFSKPADNVRIFADAFVIGGGDKKGKKDG